MQLPVFNNYKFSFISGVRRKRNYVWFPSLSKRYKHNLYDKHVVGNWHILNAGMLSRGYDTECHCPYLTSAQPVPICRTPQLPDTQVQKLRERLKLQIQEQI